MRKVWGRTLALFLAVCMALTLAGCAQSGAGVSGAATTSAAADKEITLSFWAGNGIVNTDELTKPEADWYLSKSIARFKENYPNVNVEINLYTDNSQVFSDFKAATLAGYGPDAVVFMNGPSLLTVKDGLQVLTDYVTDEERKNIVGWDTVSVDMDVSKDVYGFPYGGQSVAAIAFNRSLVAKAGLDFDNNPPRTIEAFYEAMDKMVAADILPFHVDESYCGLVLNTLNLWWAQKTGIDGILAHTNGTTKYADDEGFLFMLNEYKKFYDSIKDTLNVKFVKVKAHSISLSFDNYINNNYIKLNIT